MDKVLCMNAGRELYSISQSNYTMTVGELIDKLQEYDKEMPVFFRHDNGYTYGSIRGSTFRTQVIATPVEEEDEWDEEDEWNDEDVILPEKDTTKALKTYNYTLKQIYSHTEVGAKMLFCDLEWTMKNGGVNLECYKDVAQGNIAASTPSEACEKLFMVYNIEKPEDYKGRSMSISDIVVLREGEESQESCWYCDRIGFIQI